MNFAIKLVKFIFSGYDIAAALLQVLKYLFKLTILAVSGFPNNETRDILNVAERAEEELELYLTISVLITGGKPPSLH